jgi:tRNA 2-thiouridine synthesizing protein A
MTNEAPVLVDARGMRCPWPALRAAKAMRQHDHIRLIADDPQAGREVAALCAQQGWTLAIEHAPGASSAYVISL